METNESTTPRRRFADNRSQNTDGWMCSARTELRSQTEVGKEQKEQSFVKGMQAKGSRVGKDGK